MNVCQSTKLGVTKQIWDDYIPHSMGIHYNPLHKSSNANLIYTSFGEALGEFVIDLCVYFAHSCKKHLEFTKLVEFMKTKVNKILQNVKITLLHKCVFMLVFMIEIPIKTNKGQNCSQL